MSNSGLLTGIQTNRGPVPVRIITATLTILIAKSGNTSYYGWAKPGSLTSAPVWRIRRLIKDTSAKWADGDQNFDNIWDNYASLSYP